MGARVLITKRTDCKDGNVESRRIEHILKHDFSAGTEKFRDELLQRCIGLIRAGEGHVVEGPFDTNGIRAIRDARDAQGDCREVSDDELDALAAAGDARSLQCKSSDDESPLLV